MTGFNRFPHTPHLAWLGGGEPRSDKVLSPAEAAGLLDGTVVLEEKMDGANIGLSLGPAGELRLQNRGQYLIHPHSGQFARLPTWLAQHGDAIAGALQDHADVGLMLFGEWCAARHSLAYTQLPDWFLMFDAFEASTGNYWNVTRRDALATQMGLASTPQVAQGQYSLSQLVSLLALQISQFRPGPPEGIVIRRDGPDWCERRSKLVRPDFTQHIAKHWRQRHIEWNRLALTSVQLIPQPVPASDCQR